MRNNGYPLTSSGAAYTILATQGGGIGIANIKNDGHFIKQCVIEFYKTRTVPMKAVLGWVRDSKGKVIDRPIKDSCNAITTMCAGGHTGEDGLGNTTPYAIELYEKV